MVVGTSLADDTGMTAELVDACHFVEYLDRHDQNLNTNQAAFKELRTEGDDQAGAVDQEKKSAADVSRSHDQLKLIRRLVVSLSETQKVSLLQDLLNSVTLPHCVSLQVASFLHRGCPPDCADFARWLPPETTLRIFAFLDPVSLARCAQVSRGWYRLAKDPSLWRRLCHRSEWRLSEEGERKQGEKFPAPQQDVGDRLSAADSESAVSARISASSGVKEPLLDWRSVFIERFRLHRNWMTGKCHVRTFNMNQALEMEHGGVTCVDFDERRIVVGFCINGSVLIWRRATNATWSVQKVVCHSGAVRCLQLVGNDLVTGSSDHTIKLWRLSLEEDWSGMVCKLTLLGHSMLVRCIQMNQDIVVSGSYDHTLKLWCLKTGECKKTFIGHTGEIWGLQFDKEKIVSSSSDTTIRIWNFDGICIRQLQGHVKGVACIAFAGNRLVSGSHDCTLRFWDLDTGECEITVDWKAGEGHKDVVRCVSMDGRRVLSASDDKAVKVWDLSTGKRLQTLSGHQDGVTCLQFNDQVVVSGSFDQTVRLWDFSVC